MQITRRHVLVALPLVGLALITLGPLPLGLLDVAVDVSQWVFERFGSDGRSPSRLQVEVGMNVVLPAIATAVVAAGFREVALRRLLIGGTLVSASIEIVQLILPGRHPELRDFALNTCGVAVGCLLGAIARSALRAIGDQSLSTGASVESDERGARGQ